MKTPKKDRSSVRTNRLVIAVSDKEKAMLEKHADQEGVTMSAFARQILKSFFKKDEM